MAIYGSVGSPDQRSASMRLYLLGGFELQCDGHSVATTFAAQRLLAFLALQSRRLRRLYVAGVLWPDVSEQRSVGSLRSALWRLGHLEYRLVDSDSETIRLSPTVRVDVQDVGLCASRLLSSPSIEASDVALMTAGGELLPDQYDEWVLIERERMRQLRFHALEILCERLTTLGRYGQAIEVGLAAVNGEPLRESSHRSLIQVHLAEANVCEALRQFNRYRELLRDELGIEPSQSLKQLLPISCFE